ncbi:MAG: ABC transporter permease [Clostridiales bacterium]|nr:ABC transporter permease [Clostridiales bacterium]
MNVIYSLTKRNVKMFFKDKGMFFTSLVTPLILLVLYATFLSNVFKDVYVQALGGMPIDERLLNGLVGGQLMSSILAVSCVTVAFCSNMLMVQDKVSGALYDITIAPVKSYQLAFSYYIASFISTLLVCLFASAVCFVYLAIVGWYLTILDVLLTLLDVILLVMLGTAMSSVVNFFLSSQGQISAVGTIVSAGYGFISGAYMPISSFSVGLQKVLGFLPGTYGTSLLRNHSLTSAIEELGKLGAPSEAITALKNSTDCNIYFFGTEVSQAVMYLILVGAIVLFMGLYVLLNVLRAKKLSKSNNKQ